MASWYVGILAFEKKYKMFAQNCPTDLIASTATYKCNTSDLI